MLATPSPYCLVVDSRLIPFDFAVKITATIISFNEEENIREACASVAWADELIVVDSESKDRTREIAAECGAKVIVRPWSGFATQKQFAADAAQHEWIFSLMRMSASPEELRQSIEGLRQRDGDALTLADGYRVARRSFYMGRWIRGGGWYPDSQLRLYRKAQGRWEGTYIHESVKMPGDALIAALHGDLLHYSVRDAAHHHSMIGQRYAPLAARQMFEQNRRTSPLRIGLAAPSAFIRSFFLKGGFRDGVAGLSIASFAAHHAFLKHILLLGNAAQEWQQQQHNTAFAAILSINHQLSLPAADNLKRRQIV
ncbi:MAG: glycosyltransferase family 2 protein [Pyrinomonadaceae bacterium]